MRLTAEELKKEFPELIDFIHGNEHFVFESLCSVDEPCQNALVFLAKEENLESLNAVRDLAVVLDKKLFDLIADRLNTEVCLVTKAPIPLCLAKISQRYFEKKLSFYDQDIHPKAIVHESAELGEAVKIGPGAVISQGVQIGNGSWVGANAFIGPNTSIGSACEIYPNVVVNENTEIGDRVTVQANTTVGSDGFGFATDKKFQHHKIPQIGRVVIEDDVEIGANSTIDRAAFDETRIRKGTKTDNQVHIAHNCDIGENCLITAKFAVAGSSKIGDRCVFGGRVSLNDHIELTNDVQIGALSGVTKSIDKPGTYAGFPLLPISEFRRVSTSLAHLPQIRRDVSRLMRGSRTE